MIVQVNEDDHDDDYNGEDESDGERIIIRVQCSRKPRAESNGCAAHDEEHWSACTVNRARRAGLVAE